MKSLLISQIVLLVLLNLQVICQCPSSSLVFHGFDSVLNFQAQYPLCKDVQNLQISAPINDPIVDFTVLEGLNVSQSIRVSAGVNSLKGLSFPDSLQGVYISAASTVTDLTALNNVRYIFHLEVLGGHFLNMSGFQSLEKVWLMNIIRDSISLSGLQNIQEINSLQLNAKVSHLPVLKQVDSLDLLTLSRVDSIESFDNLRNVTSFDTLEHLAIYQIDSFSAFGIQRFDHISTINLNEINRLDVEGFKNISQQDNLSFGAIESFVGLHGLSNVRIGGISIGRCPSIVHLNFFQSLQQLTRCGLGNNPNLTDISALNQADTLLQVVLRDNPLLSFCNEPKICQAIKNPEATVTISGNAAGCGSVEEVAALCAVATQETAADLEVFPLITKQELSFAEQDKVMQISIYNLSGQKVATKYGASCDLSLLGTGVYLYVATSKTNQVFTGKFFR